MGQSASSPPKVVEQAKTQRTDLQQLDYVRNALMAADNTATFRPGRGGAYKSRNVYAGDLSAEDPRKVNQLRPLLVLEYKRKDHAATVRDGLSGNLLMMLVHEVTDPDTAFYGRGHEQFLCWYWEGVEARVYANCRPVAVCSDWDELDVSPSPQIDNVDRTEIGPSMVQLLKGSEPDSITFHRRRKDGSGGSLVGQYTKTRGRAAVFKLCKGDVVDPIVLLVVSWFAAIEK